jgi:predicted O-methyltransferase YrrM
MSDNLILRKTPVALKASSAKFLWQYIRGLRFRYLRYATPPRLLDRANLTFYELRYPRHPWLTKQANLLLVKLLKPTDIGLEWGTGRSTLWFAPRLKHLTSVEHNEAWYEVVSAELKARNIQNVNYHLHKVDAPGTNPQESAYVSVVDDFSDNSLDFVLVDGIYRGACINKVLDKIRPGGILVLDQANLFLPSDSRSLGSLPENSTPASDDWKLFLTRAKGWRLVWTSNGIFDNAIWFKPAS